MTHPGTPVLAAGARTPIGRLGGALGEVPAVELGGHAVAAALARCPGIEPDYVLLGNVLQAGNGQNPARVAAVRGGVRREVPGLTLNDVCLASMTALEMGARLVRDGQRTAVLVGGFDSMTQSPHAARVRAASTSGDRVLVDLMVHDGLWCSIEQGGMGQISERENQRLGIGRSEQDAYALRSHQRAISATDEGRFGDEISPFPVAGSEVGADEGIRRDTSLDGLSALRPAFSPEGSITAGNASQLSDAASAGIVTTLERARAAGIEPLARIGGGAIVGGPDSSLHLRPADAARAVLAADALSPAEVDLWEINEAFAGVVLASTNALGVDPERVNVNGGAIAVGHPLAATGFRLVLTLALELRRRGGGLGIAALCGGGGQGEALLVEVQ